MDETATASTPTPPLTAGTTGATSKSSLKSSSFTWKKTLQEFFKLQSERQLSLMELHQLKRIAILEAQLALSNGVTDDDDQSKSTRSRRSRLRSKASSKASQTSSQSTKRPALTAASAHSRLDGIESSMEGNHRMRARLTGLLSWVPIKYLMTWLVYNSFRRAPNLVLRYSKPRRTQQQTS